MKKEMSLKGQLLVELLLTIALSAIMIPALLTGLAASREGKAQQNQRVEAVGLLKEAEEAVRSVREKDWNNFTTSGIFHPVVNANAWSFAPGDESVNGFTRELTISDIYRNSSGAIVESGGTLDPSTKKVDISVSWGLPYFSAIDSTMFVTRFLSNTVQNQSSQLEFNTGTTQNTQVTGTGGGAITLANNTKGKWCEPHISSLTIDLPAQAVAVTATEGHVYVATREPSSPTTTSFAHVLVSTGEPPTFTLGGKLGGYDARAVYGEPDWGYIATTDNNKEIVIVNLNEYADSGQKIYKEEGYFNTTTKSWWGGTSNVTTDADAIFVMNDRGYVTAGPYLYVFDLSSKSGLRPQIGNRISIGDYSGDSAGEIFGKVINGETFIFVAVQGSTPDEMKIVNVTNPNNSSQWREISGINIEPNGCSSLESGKAIYVNPAGTRAYISSSNDNNFKEFFSLDTTNKFNPILIGGFATNPPCTNGGGYEAGGMDPEQSVVVSALENRAILVGIDSPGGDNSEEYQVLDLTNEANPTKCGGIQFDQGIYGVASVKESDGDAYAYLITGDTASDLKVVQGGPDGTYVEDGIYTSEIFDFGKSVALNRLSSNATVPPQTTLKYQIAGADPVSGSCTNATYSFVGPDGTTDTFFEPSGGAIFLNDDGSGFENPAQCVRYKAYLSTHNYNATPEILDVVLNYSE